jgi:hypothetical protein
METCGLAHRSTSHLLLIALIQHENYGMGNSSRMLLLLLLLLLLFI